MSDERTVTIALAEYAILCEIAALVRREHDRMCSGSWGMPPTLPMRMLVKLDECRGFKLEDRK